MHSFWSTLTRYTSLTMVCNSPSHLFYSACARMHVRACAYTCFCGVCVCVCAHVCVSVCVCVCERECVCVCACV